MAGAIVAIIPAYEPPVSFPEYAKELLKTVDRLVVVDDGSSDACRDVFRQLEELEGAVLLSYGENHGKGYALRHAFAYCREHFAPTDILVTADCDGQHTVRDIIRVCNAAAQSPDSLVLGVRDFDQENVPARSRAGNTSMRRLLRWLYSVDVADTQTGLRAFSVATAEKLLQVRGNRFEYETGMLIYAKRNQIPLAEVEIETVYPEVAAEHVSHFRTITDSLRVIGTLLGYLGGYLLSSGISALADIAIFVLLTSVVFPTEAPLYTMIATVTARLCSSLINFGINCKHIFHGKPRQAITRYYLLWAVQLCCSYGIVYLFGHVLGGWLSIVKIIGDLFLAVISYQIQCRWVFRQTTETHIYSRFGRFVRWLLRTFSPRYRSRVPQTAGPAVYVCRHLDMHGPYTTLKWLPGETHPMVYQVFMETDSAIRQFKDYTFSVRAGKQPPRFSLKATIVGAVTAPTVRSLRAVPVFRGDNRALTTLRTALAFLLKSEKLIVYPDIEYTGSYENESDIYGGFLYLGQMYFRKTGQSLPFVPLTIDDEKRLITAGDPVTADNYKQDAGAAAAALKAAINK